VLINLTQTCPLLIMLPSTHGNSLRPNYASLCHILDLVLKPIVDQISISVLSLSGTSFKCI